jgi:YtkA-like protein
MRGIWQLAIAGGVVAAVVLVVSGFLLFEHGGTSSNKTASGPSPTSTTSYGNADIAASAPAKPRAQGGPYQRIVDVRPKDRRSGVPIHGAEVTIHGEMVVPHAMTTYNKNLSEVAPGEYKGPYTLIMPGDWRFVIVVRTKKGDTSTRALPVRVTG